MSGGAGQVAGGDVAVLGPSADCTLEIATTLLGPAPLLLEKASGRQYRITGHGECSEPAVDLNTAGPAVSVGPFSFRVRQSFYD